MLITANQPFGREIRSSPDPGYDIGRATSDRLVHHAHPIFEMNGESYRRRPAQKTAGSAWTTEKQTETRQQQR